MKTMFSANIFTPLETVFNNLSNSAKINTNIYIYIYIYIKLRKRQLCGKLRPAVTGCFISDRTIIHSVQANNACIAQ